MLNEISYIKLNEVLSRVLRHPLLLQSVDIESAVLYTVDFIHTVGCPQMFETKLCKVPINNYRGVLPCGCISIVLVKDNATGYCMRAMSDNFLPNEKSQYAEHSFKTQGNIIYTSLKEGTVDLVYKAVPVDEDGYPLLIDDPIYLKALELYIKKEVFTILFDTGKIQAGVMNKAEQDYAWKVGQLQSRLFMPSESEMESISREWCTLILRTGHFNNGFRSMGNQEHFRTH